MAQKGSSAPEVPASVRLGIPGHQIGAATAALGAGFSRTAFASYLPAFFAAGALCMIAAILVLTIAKPEGAGLAAAPAPARG